MEHTEVMSVDDIKNNFDNAHCWGLSTSVDIRNCNPEIIKSAAAIQDYVIQLCKLIDMKRHGDCLIENFGEDEKVAGYTVTQLIETSSITGHFANKTNNGYIDIFSCKFYDVVKAAQFTMDFFGAEEMTYSVLLRR